MELTGLKELVLVYDDKQLRLAGEQLDKFKKNLSTVLYWAGLHNYNLIATDPVKYEQLDMQENDNVINDVSVNDFTTTTTKGDSIVIMAEPESHIKRAKKVNPKQ